MCFQVVPREGGGAPVRRAVWVGRTPGQSRVVFQGRSGAGLGQRRLRCGSPGFVWGRGAQLCEHQKWACALSPENALANGCVCCTGCSGPWKLDHIRQRWLRGGSGVEGGRLLYRVTSLSAPIGCSGCDGSPEGGNPELRPRSARGSGLRPRCIFGGALWGSLGESSACSLRTHRTWNPPGNSPLTVSVGTVLSHNSLP